MLSLFTCTYDLLCKCNKSQSGKERAKSRIEQNKTTEGHICFHPGFSFLFLLSLSLSLLEHFSLSFLSFFLEYSTCVLLKSKSFSVTRLFFEERNNSKNESERERERGKIPPHSTCSLFRECATHWVCLIFSLPLGTFTVVNFEKSNFELLSLFDKISKLETREGKNKSKKFYFSSSSRLLH